MIEREDELECLASLLDDSDRRRSATGMITGGVGLGKTTLLEALTERAAAAGHTVLSAIGIRLHLGYPFAVLEQLFHGAELGGGGVDLSRLLEETARTYEQDPSLSMARITQAVHRALVELSARGRVVISVDDVQYADAQSLQVLLHIIQRCRRMPLTVFITHGGPSTAAPQTLLAELACRPGVVHVRLEPLTEAGMTELISRCLGPAATQRCAGEYLAVSGGNHLLAQALLGDHAAGRTVQDGDNRSPAGDLFRGASLASVHRAGTDVLRVAWGVAVLDGHDSPEVLGRLVELGDFTVSSSMRILEESRLLEGTRFRHPAIRDAVLQDIPPDERARQHRRAAGLLREQGAAAQAMVRHLLAAGPVHDEWVTRLLVEAAEQALAEDDVALATRCLQLADACCTDEQQRYIIKVTLARIMWRDRPGASTRMLQTLIGPARNGSLPGVTTLHVAYGLLERGRMDEAVTILKRLIPPDEDTNDPHLATELDVARLALASTFPAASRELGDSLATLPRPAGRGGGTGPHRLTARHALWTALVSNRQDPVADAERVLQSVQIGDDSIVTLISAIMALVYAERLKTAESWCDVLLAQAVERQAPTWRALLTSIRAFVSLRQGDLRAAAEGSEAALQRMSEEVWVVDMGLPLATLIEARTALGDHDGAAEAVARPIPPGLLQTRFGLHYLYARGRYHQARGHHDAAQADYFECGDRMKAWELDSPVLAPWRLGAAEVLLAGSHRDRAAKLLEEHLGLCGRGQRRTYGMALRALAGTRAPSQRVELLSKALETLQPTGDRYEVALTLAELGRAYQWHGQAGKARLLVRQAWHLAKECGAADLVSALMPKPAGSGSQRSEQVAQSGTGSVLSDAELRVTSLAAQGYTNREISAKLFITVSTVEQHLTRAYRKLNIRHRQDLPSTFAS